MRGVEKREALRGEKRGEEKKEKKNKIKEERIG